MITFFCIDCPVLDFKTREGCQFFGSPRCFLGMFLLGLQSRLWDVVLFWKCLIEFLLCFSHLCWHLVVLCFLKQLGVLGGRAVAVCWVLMDLFLCFLLGSFSCLSFSVVCVCVFLFGFGLSREGVCAFLVGFWCRLRLVTRVPTQSSCRRP